VSAVVAHPREINQQVRTWIESTVARLEGRTQSNERAE
jgi:hypothetical protein